MSEKQLLKLAKRLFPDEDELKQFVEAVQLGRSRCPAVIWTAHRETPAPFECREPVKGQPDFVDVVADDVRAGNHPHHEQGKYYCLDFSSVLIASAMGVLLNEPRSIIDLCAAPGGKAIFAARCFAPEMLVANEVIGKRLGSLIANFKRCNIPNSIVTRADTSVLARDFSQQFDLAIVDAPCSGQSLLSRGIEAPGCFHPAVVEKSAMRQRRIIANAQSVVRPGGHLLYSTCTFDPEENEQIIQWFLKRFQHFEPVMLPHLQPFRSPLLELPCYRIYPHQGHGSGGFVALLQATGASKVRQRVIAKHPYIVWQSARMQ